ncbi:sigma-70 family RNA polymerase sigma factor [Horticoccus luteus]|uniref:Sigma-70 family RNA polymerase sigma factor n=2 Tax=Horticoccus luteus TaxID=2862869 RepID=A0A8F9TX51_9BACT|nr:sigma-70 family RNA polymerase sigma factor [Horticoccus luteus]
MRNYLNRSTSTSSASTSSLADPVSPQEKSERSKSESAYDATLVQRFNNGDEAAFIEIMDRYRAKIFNVTLALLRNHSDAEEITQDTFIRAHRGLGKFRGDSSLATWLYRIAVNLARNRYWYFFRRRRHATLSLDCPLGDDTDAPFADLIAADVPDPAQESARDEFAALVAECMEKLDRRHRQILTMRNTLHMAYEDIATSLGINVGTVKSRIARARENLRNLLTTQCPEFSADGSPADYFLPNRATGRLAVAYA